MSTDSKTPAATTPATVLTEASYGRYYYAHCCGRPYSREQAWLDFFGSIADRIVRDIAPRRVLDAGCAWGLLVEALRGRDVDARGLDLSSYAIGQVEPATKPFCWVGSLTDSLPDRYDLIVCMEVLEHIPAALADQAIANLCAHTDDILFSSSPLDFREPTHVNVQPPEAWAEAFARHGFFRDADFDASFVTSWAVRFRRSSEPLPRLVRQMERRYLRTELERNEARAFAAERITELESAHSAAASAIAERDAADTERQAAQVERQAAQVRSEAAIARANEADAEREAMATRLGHALAIIRDMERSVFWKLRGLWVRLNRLIGRDR